jgi:plastocyanin
VRRPGAPTRTARALLVGGLAFCAALGPAAWAAAAAGPADVPATGAGVHAAHTPAEHDRWLTSHGGGHHGHHGGGVASVALAQATADSATIVDFAFNPGDLTVPVGTTVTWTNDGDRPHTVTDRGGTFDTGPVAPDTSNEVTFTVPGRYLYFCRINPGSMNGVITVTPGPEPSPVTRVQGLDPGREGETLRFDPNQLSVEAGSTIVFASVGGKPHSLTADDGSFDTGIVPPGAEAGRFAGTNASVTLDQPGTFTFHCEVHPDAMTGQIEVTGTARDGPAAASEAAREATVEVVDFAFEPPEASVAPGGTVTFPNQGEAPHTATFDDGGPDTGQIEPGAEGTITAPDEPGSYSYFCAVHPGRMRAVLVVVGQNADDPTTEAAAAPPADTGSDVGGGISALVLATGVIGAFVAGFGISAFVRNRMGATPPTGATTPSS